MQFTPYRNLNGDSGVTAYAFGQTSIQVEFKHVGVYEYDYAKPGAAHVEAMKSLAQDGRGLATYINQHVRKNYARKV